MSDKITLKAARVNAGYTQEEVAKLIKVSIPTLKKWEDNQEDIKISQARKLCNLYKKDINDIFFEN